MGGFVSGTRPRSRCTPSRYAGDGAETDGKVVFANSDPTLIKVFLRWLRAEFEIDESRLRVALYLHADLDLEAPVQPWSRVTDIRFDQFQKPHRAVVDETMRHDRHLFGCASMVYSDSSGHRSVMAKARAIGSARADPG